MNDRRYPWVVLAIVLAGTYLVVLDTMVLGVALASIAEDLHAADSVGIDWIITSYLIAVGCVQPATAWLADRFGRKQVYLAALAAFTVSSLLAGIAPNLELLIVARILQGLGGGAMMPVGMAMVWDQFPPHKRGMAMGIHGMAVMAAPAFGPVFGGYVVESVSWRWLFLVNLPIGAVAMVLAWWKLRSEAPAGSQRLDLRGWALASVAVIVIVLGFREAVSWGVVSAGTAVVAVAGIALLTLAIRWFRRVEHPLLELGMFSVPTFRRVMVMNSLMTASMYARVAYLPTEMQLVQGHSAQHVGVLFMFGAFGIASMMPVGGWLADRIGPRWPVVGGQVVVAASLVALANITAGTTDLEMVAILVGGGLGIGLSASAPTVAGMNALPPRWIGQASTMNSLTRQVAGAISTSVLAAVLVGQIGAVVPPDAASRPDEVLDAYGLMFYVALGAVVLTVLLATRLPSGRPDAAAGHAVGGEQQDVGAVAGPGGDEHAGGVVVVGGIEAAVHDDAPAGAGLLVELVDLEGHTGAGAVAPLGPVAGAHDDAPEVHGVVDREDLDAPADGEDEATDPVVAQEGPALLGRDDLDVREGVE